MNHFGTSLNVQKGYAISTILYASAHLLVDCISAYLILGRLSGKDHFSEMIVLYNFCAFALQMPLGAFADQMETCTWLSTAGMGLLALLSIFGPRISMYAAALAALTGIGNSLFHIGCGTQVLRADGGTCRDSGLFVSTGAIGLFLGSRCAYMEPGWLWYAMLSLFCFLFFILLAADAVKMERNLLPGNSKPFPSRRWRRGRQTEAAAIRPGADGKLEAVRQSGAFGHPHSVSEMNPARNRCRGNCSEITGSACMICSGILFLVVVLRSFLGCVVNFPWKKEYAAVIVCIVAFGKMFGGVIADLFGERRVIPVSLLLAAILFPVSAFPGAGIAAMFLFNMTMPVTLVCLSRIIESPGLAFGILTFALFVGYLPLPFGFVTASFKPLLYAAIAILSLVLMALSLMLEGYEKQREIRREKFRRS